MNKKLFGIVGAVLLVCAVAIAQAPNVLVYLEQGGAKQVVLSGGEVEVRSGGTLDVQSGATFTQAGTITQTGAVNQDSKLDILSGGELEISSGATFEFVSGGTWTVADGAIPRADLTEDALAVYDIGTDLVVTAAYATIGMAPEAGYANSTGIYLKGPDSQNTTITTDNVVDFRLPPEYVAGGDIKFSCYTKYAGTGTVGATKTIDIVAKKVTVATGALGADICATTPITLTNAYALAEFTITATGLVAGDVIQINLATALQETGNMNPIASYVINPHVQLDIKG
jgi:hypothetical protein